LIDYCRKEPIDVFVIGEPRHLNGKLTDATELTNLFVKQLQKQFPSIPVERIDERYTSKIAFQSIIDSGLKKKDRRNKSIIDEVSAVLLLQSYMEKR
jgi:putative Holliday junction resolvase